MGKKKASTVKRRRRTTRAGARSAKVGSRTTRAMAARTPLPPVEGKVIALAMLVRILGDDLEIVRVEAARRKPNPKRVRRPMASPSDGPIGRAELVLEFMDASGQVLQAGSVAWASTLLNFVDQGSVDDAQGLTGRPHPPRDDVRFLQVSLPRTSAYLHFYRQQVSRSRRPGGGRGGRATMTRDELAVFRLWPDPPRARFWMSPFPIPPGPSPVPDLELRWCPWWLFFGGRHGNEAPLPPVLKPMPPGHIDSHDTLINNGDPAKLFDIVILGEGFQEGELEMFNGRVNYLLYGNENGPEGGGTGLLGLEPFHGAANNINVHVVRVVSTDSGVDESPYRPVRKQTYFNVTGDWEGEGSPSDFGSPTPERVRDAAALIANPEDLDLFIVMVNSAIYGGKAHPGDKTVYAGIDYQGDRFVNLVAHEAGHVIANLAEEDLRGVNDFSDIEARPNAFRSTADLVQNINLQDVPWAAHADTKPNGDWEAIHFYSDDLMIKWPDPPISSTYPVEPVRDNGASFGGEVGLFWGCMYIESDSPGAYGAFDSRGRHFYRPSARCKMRRLSWDFCKICSGEMKERIMYP